MPEGEADLIASRQGSLGFLRELLGELPARDPLLFALSRIARAIDGTAIVYAQDGTILAESGPAPAHLLRDLPAGNPSGGLHHRVGRWCAAVRRTKTPDGKLTVVLATRNGASEDEVIEPLLDLAEIVLLSATARGRNLAAERRREQEQLLTALAEGVPISRERRIRPSLEEFGFPARCRLVALIGEAAEPAEAVAVLEAEAMRQRVPLLLSGQCAETSPDGPAVRAIAPAEARRREFPQDPSRQLSSIGFSAPFSALSDAPRAFRQAQTAQRVALERKRAAQAEGVSAEPPRVGYEELDLAGWLNAEADRTGMRLRCQRFLAPLADSPELLETLVVYLAAHQRIAPTAAAMYLHPNTIRYRLGRVAQLSGCDITAPSFIANLYLCLEARIRAAECRLSPTPSEAATERSGCDHKQREL